MRRLGIVLGVGCLALTACRSDGTPRSPVDLVAGDGLYTELAYAPDGRRISYVRRRNDRAELWVATAQGRDAVQLFQSREVSRLLWSPDGEWIAFASDSSEAADAWQWWAVPASGGDARQLTTGPGLVNFANWAPDGQSLVVNNNPAGTWGLYTVPRDGSGTARLLYQDEGYVGGWPAWTPDGSRLVFYRGLGGRNLIMVYTGADGSVRQLTEEGFEDEPALSPDGREVAYVSGRTGRSDIWVVPLDGGGPRRLTSDIAREERPRWSPDGRLIAYWSDRGGQPDLWVVPAEGGVSVPVTDDELEEGQFSWHADGRHLIYISNHRRVSVWLHHLARGDSRQLVGDSVGVTAVDVSPAGDRIVYAAGHPPDLWLQPVTGGAPRQLTAALDEEYAPEWLPDGRHISYLTRRGAATDLWVVPDTGGPPVNIIRFPGNIREARWSPDLTRIVISAESTGVGRGLWTLPATGGTLTRLTPSRDARHPEWSPDGRWIAFSGAHPPLFGLGVFVVPASGGAATRLPGTEVGHSHLPRWSPDQTRILWFQGISGRPFELHVAAPDGSGARVLAPHEGQDLEPRWSPDGSRIVFRTGRPSGMQIAVTDLTGAEVQVVTSGSALHRRPAWAEGGQSIVYERTDVESKVMKVRLPGMSRPLPED